MLNSNNSTSVTGPPSYGANDLYTIGKCWVIIKLNGGTPKEGISQENVNLNYFIKL